MILKYIIIICIFYLFACDVPLSEEYILKTREETIPDSAVKMTETSWTQPINIEIVNTIDMDGFPYISQDGNELWFTRQYLGTPAIYRSKKISNELQEPELIISQFAGEPTLDAEGNIYFVHHFYKDDEMIEADIYIAYKK